MKNINFISTVAPQRQRELRRWIIGIVVVICVGVSAVIGIHSMQWHAIRALAQEKRLLVQKEQILKPIHDRYLVLMHEEKTLKEHLNKLNRCTTCTKNPIEYIKAIMNVCAKATTIHVLDIRKKQMELILGVATIDDVIRTIEQLSHNALFRDLTLVSMHPAPNQSARLLCTIKGVLG